jgi:hypothetical protein
MSYFRTVFGFDEKEYKVTKKKLKKKYENENGKINGISCGDLKVVSLITPIHPSRISGNVKLSHVFGDVRNFIRSYPNATFQVASQANLLEMIDPFVTPEQGISIYENDETQGPICAIAAPTATAYRNYLVEMPDKSIGQTSTQQINIFNDFHDYIASLVPEGTSLPLFNMRNGYVMFDNEKQLNIINCELIKSPDIRRIARSLIKVGIHSDVGVADYTQNPCKEMHQITQVFCSGLPIEYNNLAKKLWYGFSEIILEAMYENTLMVAVEQNKKNNKFEPCFLTLIGGGVFGMKHSQIKRAIVRACNIIAVKGHKLDVRVIHYKKDTISEQYMSLPPEYPLLNYDSASIWDNVNWVISTCI